jgi:hypothetical protein
MHSGAAVTLAPGRYRLGSDSANDIVLADPGVSPSHAVLDLLGDRAGITALGPGVLVQRRQLPTGRPAALKRGTVITVGATRLRVSGPAGSTHHISATICLALLGLACAGAAYSGATPVAAKAAPFDQPTARSNLSGTLTRAAADFRTHLADAHIASDVRVSASDGVVLAAGTILPQDRAAWLDAQKWFDSHLGGHYALANHVSVATAAELPQLEVAAVSMAPVPNVITHDGQRYTVGAVLHDGWCIDSITPNDIILRSGQREIRIGL